MGHDLGAALFTIFVKVAGLGAPEWNRLARKIEFMTRNPAPFTKIVKSAAPGEQTDPLLFPGLTYRRRWRFPRAHGKRLYAQGRQDASAIDRAEQQKRDRKRDVLREPTKSEAHDQLQNCANH
jgi:hypothetical protein